MKKLLLLPLVLFAAQLFAAYGDTLHIISHRKTHIQTNPAIGYTKYANWAVFPAANVGYRKVLLTITFSCPPGSKCGEWDYINYIKIQRQGSANSSPRNLTIAKFITPYGLGYAPSWKFSWELDMTDFALLLHDSVEIEYVHTGYEQTANRGWLVTLDWQLTLGNPTYIPLAIDTLWQGSHAFGNVTRDFENYLSPRTVTVLPTSTHQRLLWAQTGHGNDTIDGCCEFADYRQDLLVDNTLSQQYQLWRRCGDNPNFPQSGTWIFDRANWCPGTTVLPFTKDLTLSAGTHQLDLEMQAKKHTRYKEGNYDMFSYFLQLQDNRYDYDATLEKVLQPSTSDELLRINGISANPKIVLKNSGKKLLTSVIIKYGLKGAYETHYKWTGALPPDKTIEVVLPNMVIDNLTTAKEFFAYTYAPSGHCDEYPYDDTMRTAVKLPPQYDNMVILVYKTPGELQWDATNYLTAADFSYQLKDKNGQIVYEKTAGSMQPLTVYRDTFFLAEGAYDFYFYNNNPVVQYGMGIWFLANIGMASGYVRLVKAGGTSLANFGNDWGAFVHQAFTVEFPTATATNITTTCWAMGMEEQTENSSALQVFPVPSHDQIFLELATNSNAIIHYQLANPLGQVLQENTMHAQHAISTKHLPAGSYMLRVTQNQQSWVKTVVVH